VENVKHTEPSDKSGSVCTNCFDEQQGKKEPGLKQTEHELSFMRSLSFL
jgi:hypothetical protein